MRICSSLVSRTLAGGLLVATATAAVHAAEVTAPPPPAARSTVDATAPRRLTLEEALAIGVAAGERVTVAGAGVDRAAAELARAGAERFPQLGASAAYTRTLASEYEDLSLDGGEGGFDFGELPFGQENRWDLGLAASQLLYAGGRVRNQQAAAAGGLTVAEAGVAGARAEVALDVVTAYLDAALADRLVAIAELQLRQGDSVLERAKLAYEVGDRSEFDLLRAQVTRDNLEPEVITRRAERTVAYLRLAQLLDLSTGMPLELVVPESETALPPLVAAAPTAAELDDPAAKEAWLARRVSVRQADANIAIRQALAEVSRGQRLPSLGLTSDYGRVAYEDGLPSLGDTRTNWTVGFGARVPIFTGGRIRAEIAAAEADVAAAGAQAIRVRELAWLETRDALERLAGARAVFAASERTVAQARRAYEIAELRYSEGLSNLLELSDARVALAQAEVNRARAAREALVSHARLALLPDLPLGTSVGSFLSSTVFLNPSGGSR